MQAKTERFEMRLDQRTLDSVDEWRSSQEDVPSRAEAIRRLVEAGLRLSGDGHHSISFSDGEKLTITMLGEIYKHLKIKGEVDPSFVTSAIYGGHNWALGWQYQGVFTRHVDDPEKITGVVDILDMWSFIESAYNKLSKEDKERIKVEAAPFGEDVTFTGFDGNNEPEYHIAHFLMHDLGRFPELKDHPLNSHSSSMHGHKRMLTAFTPMRRTLIGKGLSATQIIEILKARSRRD